MSNTAPNQVEIKCTCGARTFSAHTATWEDKSIRRHSYTGPSYPDRRSCCGASHTGPACQ